jgi:hypothetical protein
MRRIRTRLPTYLSTGFGALVDISTTPTPRDQAPVDADEADHIFDANTVKSCSEIGEDCRQFEQ